jgi:hypothetical protein
MSTLRESATLSQTIPQALTETGTNCPLHLAMGEIARLSVTQHVLYLEGECLPRPDIARELEIWSSLHALVSTRLCVAARTTPLDQEEFAAALEGIRARVKCSETSGSTTHQFQYDVEQTLTQCLTCARSCSCPLGDPAAPHIEPSSLLPGPMSRPDDEGKHVRAEAAGESQHKE